MKTILVPSDLSRESTYALEVAVAVARKTGAEVRFQHVIQTAFEKEFNTGRNLPEEIKFKLEADIEEARKHMQKNIGQLEGEIPSIVPDVKVGSVFENVSAIIAHEKIDLIVMSTSGTSGFRELFDGSNAERVVRYARCPVLTVRNKIKDFTIRDLVLATDLVHMPKEFAHTLNTLQELFQFSIHLLYVNTPLNYSTTFDIEEKIEKYLKKHPLNNCTPVIINEYSFEDGIQKYAAKIQAGLIAMTTHGRDGISYLLDGSITERIVNHSAIPVLTYRM